MLALDIQNLKKTYSNGVEALKGINLSVSQGEFIALLGPNGAGKSTTISIMNSLALKTSGQVNIFGYSIDSDPSESKSHIGVVPQEFNFGIFEKIYDILINQAGYFGIDRNEARKRAKKYLTMLELWEKKDQQARTLSGGMKRRLMIARALMHEPQLLILDEPTAGVDVEIRRSMWSFLRELNAGGRTIILTTHYLEEAETLCDRIAIINRGEIIQDTSKRQLLAQLNSETFVLDLMEPLSALPKAIPTGFNINQVDSMTLAVEIKKSTKLNVLFDFLNANAISVTSMRNQSNRLEELFLRLTQSQGSGENNGAN